MKRILCAGAGLVLAAICGGCASTGSYHASDTGAPIQLSASKRLRFDDIPVPAGFQLIQDQSLIFQDDHMRVGLLKYSGRAKPEDIVRFYRDQMPLQGWTLLNTIEFGISRLSFEKDGEFCHVDCEGTWRKAVVSIAVGPAASREKSTGSRFSR